jgi:uncharacterized protein
MNEVKNIIFSCISGSNSYGLNIPTSDIDVRGIFIVPMKDRLSIYKHVEEVNDEKQDIKYYELEKFIRLAAGCNPNIIELLWTNEKDVLISTEKFKSLQTNRNLFITERAFHTFSGYAYAQIQKATGQNKLVHNPEPKEKPKKEDFCWIIGKNGNGNPVPLKDWYSPTAMLTMNTDYKAVSIKHLLNAYRLYLYKDSGGIFRGDDMLVTCDSIPLEDEYKYTGILIYNKEAFDQALKRWHRYWEWIKNRNEHRWVDQTEKHLDYDAKNLMHCVRLLYSGINIFENGEPIVRFSGEKQDRLFNIRHGKLSYEEIIKETEYLIEKMKILKEKTSLPKSPDVVKIDEVFYSLLMWA